MSGFLLLINSNYRRKINMNYNEIRRLYDNVDNDELVTQTAYELSYLMIIIIGYFTVIQS